MTDRTGTPAVIVPFGAAAGVPFGTPRAEVRRRFGEPTTSYRGSAWQNELSDRYADVGLTFGYAEGGLVDEIELMDPARPEVAGVALLDGTSQETVDAITAAGQEVRAFLGLREVAAWGIGLFVQGDRIGERPFDTVTAFAHGQVPDPEFLEAPGTASFATAEIDPGGFGPLRLGMERAEARSLLGAAMVIAIPGRDPVDYHFSANVAVTYDGQDTARRISVMAPGSSVSSAPVSVGTAFGQCLDALREASIAHEEREAEIFLRDTGIRLLTSRAGDASLPVSSVVVERG